MKILSKEIALINELSKIINRKRKTRSGLIVGIGDDAAILKVPPHENLIVTTDCLIENVHFTLKTTSPRQLGWKSLAVNLSDIASMGGVPLYGFISIAIPSHIDEAWIKEFYRGIKKCSDKFNVVIAGGDTSRSPHELMINVVIIGQSEGKKAALRSSAKAGDLLLLQVPSVRRERDWRYFSVIPPVYLRGSGHSSRPIWSHSRGWKRDYSCWERASDFP